MYYLSDLCSLCLVHNQNMKSILSIDSDDILIEEKLKTFLVEPIHFKPHIPKYICENCLKNLNFIHKFKLSCIENIATLNSYVEILEVHGPHTNLSVTLLTHRKYIKEEVLELENQNNSETCKNQIQTNCPQNNNVVQNEFIKEEIAETGIVYDENIIMAENRQINSADVNTEIIKDIKIPLEEKLTIDLNNKQGPYEVFMQFNEEKHIIDDSENLASDDTTTSTANENIMKIGRKNKNNKKLNKKLYNCTIRSYKCSVCNKVFRARWTLIRHEQIHSGEKPYECNVCNKVFARRSNLTIHERIHSGEKPHECKVCNKEFITSSGLTKHERIHTGVKPYECNVCNKAFTDRANLIKHERIHNGEKPYKCNVCNKAFISSSDLTKHERIHTGEKPYECNVCNRAFRQRGYLTKHVLIHSGEKPYKCKVCKKSFRVRSNLSKHERIHTK